MHNELIQDFSSILIIGSIFGWIFKRFFKLPLILGYIFGGVCIKALVPFMPIVIKPETVYTLSELGVLLLVFSMGLHFSLQKVKALGMRIVCVALIQAVAMWITGVEIALYFGFENMQAQFLGASICATSTAVILKVIEDFQLKSARFTEKVFGLLLIEDTVAIFLIIWLTAKDASMAPTSHLLLKLIPIFLGSIALWWILGTILVPRFIHAAFQYGKEELLIIMSVGLALGLAYLSSTWNFSPALGAFIMGSIMSDCRELNKIEQLIEPVKNLFALIFFVSVGLLFNPDVLIFKWKLILSIIICVTFIKVFYNFFLNLLLGENIKDSLRISSCLVQIGEVGFVVIQSGRNLGILNEEIFSIIVSVSIITMLTTPIFMKLFLSLADNLENILPQRGYAALDSYSRAMNDLSLTQNIARHKEKFFGIRHFNYVFELLKNRVKRNYSLLTSRNKSATFDRLAPWDEYLVPVQVISDSIVSGKSLIELKFRETFGVNIVAIQRENRFIVSPNPKELVLGNDHLIVYGSEECIIKLENYCARQVDFSLSRSIDDCALRSIILSPSHQFVGNSILEIGVRNTYNCIVLAVKRNEERIKNPVSTFVFAENDEIYLFGTKNSLAHISNLDQETH